MSQQPKDYRREYVAEVVNVQDPLKQMRVQVRVYDFFDGVPVADLPWATYRLPLGVRPADGGVIPVQVGDKVWVDFPNNGDTRRPRIVGGVHSIPEGKPNVPAELWQGAGLAVHKRAEGEPVPESPGYHEDVVFKQHGVLVQLTKSGALRATQLSSGSALEIAPDGTIVIHSENSILMSAPSKIFMQAGGASTLNMDASGITLKGPRIDLN